ncbi:HAD family hydrolase [Crateriforma spongiae]|uniref:hypothetical protein n=1 Tax=Crateriforma spongiae TaxID=2724528 RepID=UPI00197EFF86|nr:hypothetical protein [Crateriforma spongiae]
MRSPVNLMESEFDSNETQIRVVDLDGTLVRCNTFHHWIKRCFLMPNAIVGVHWLYVAPLAFALTALRLLGCVSHRIWKMCFLLLWEYVSIWKDREKTEVRLRMFVQDILERYGNGLVIDEVCGRDSIESVLATAAPGVYAKYFAEHLSAVCLATGNPTRIAAFRWEFEENVSEAKASRVLSYANGKPFTFYTDHPDDWPAIKIAERVVLVAAEPGFVSEVRGVKGASCRVLDACPS